ncbi:MAG: histidine--tRNA ligase [Campylobacteraceae bacterium]|jgi:histidyl-tRNA synthetase|nr:histidine--tRNA ligase [Campylobacteraceae bacterium]
MINALRGMKDIIFEEGDKYLYFTQNCARIAANYGFSYISTPILEETALFKRSVGESSDIVGKEMYQFTDKGGNDVCLRPEGTAGIVRSFIQNKFDKAGGVKRFFYYGPMFRYERPQKGRLRQFHQFGVESFGVSDVKEDAAVILMLSEMLSFFGIKSVLKLNSLGCSKCMPSYRARLVRFLNDNDGLCEDCLRRKILNPIRVFDCKNEHCQILLKGAPILLNELCDECEDEFKRLRAILTNFNIDYEIDPKLVRGLDYYSKTAFEFVSTEIGAQSSVAGGGRYDRLVEFLGGRSAPAVGFAIGIERLLELIKMPSPQKCGVYIGILDERFFDFALKIAVELRRKIKVYTDYEAKNPAKILKNADRLGAKQCILIGENEVKSGTVRIKNLEEKIEFEIDLDLLGEFQW